MLSDRTKLKVFLRIQSSDTSQDTLLDQLLVVADRIVKAHVRRDLETTLYTDFYDGQGVRDLVLRQRPVRGFWRTGTLTSGSAIVTGLSDTSDLLVGTPCVGTGVPSGTVISTIGSSTQVTLSASATASGSASLHWGLACWVDPSGFYGDRSGAFASTSEQTLGTHYALLRDAAGGISKKGLLRRLAGIVLGGLGPTDWPWGWPTGPLAARADPVWPRGTGNVKVVYLAGYGVGASVGGSMPASSTLPAELTYCVNAIAGVLRGMTPAGAPINVNALAQHLADMLGRPVVGESAEISTVRGVLTSYVEHTI